MLMMNILRAQSVNPILEKKKLTVMKSCLSLKVNFQESSTMFPNVKISVLEASTMYPNLKVNFRRRPRAPTLCRLPSEYTRPIGKTREH